MFNVPWCYHIGHFASLTSTIGPGTANDDRIGSKIVLNRLQIYFNAYWDFSNEDERIYYAHFARVRFVGFLWKDDTTPTVADLFDQVSTSYIDQASLPPTWDKKAKRKILWDRTINMRNDMSYEYKAMFGPLSSHSETLYYDFTKLPLEQRTVAYSTDTVAINQVYLFVIADCYAPNLINQYDYGPTVRIFSRLSYTDA